jgi:hypothetical protein
MARNSPTESPLLAPADEMPSAAVEDRPIAAQSNIALNIANRF